MKKLGFLLALAGCSSSTPVDYATLGSLAYAVPASWASRDLSTHQRAMIEWAPRDPDRKESIVVMRVERAQIATQPRRTEQLLRDAQQSLPRGKFGSPERIASRAGLAGTKIEGEFRCS